ncbi:fibronectin type III domain-containing protein [Flagellimonas sp. DF-77]|uniref:fibronectin type III domain-containing protein n=1 Tax=Flagellimonas algarum TaxID=3230298 RepID=UPI003392388C
MNNRITILLTAACVLTMYTTSAQNLVDSSDWVSGTTGSTTNWSMLGNTSQNSRITMTGPLGNQVTVWEAAANGASGMNGGLWYNSLIVDTSKSYRVSFWIRSEGPTNCDNRTGFVPYYTTGGLVQPFEHENGSNVSWPTFTSVDQPNNKWYLMVAYVRPGAASDLGDSGLYDPSLGSASNVPAASYSASDFIFPSSVGQIDLRIRAFLWACASGEKMYIYDPRVEEVPNSTPLATLLYGTGSGDTQAPTVPTGLASTGQTQNTINLTWNSASDNTAVTGYRVFQNGSSIATIGNTTSYQVTGLSSATTYTFSVKALDAAGNESANSTTINVTTDSGSSGGGGSSGSSLWTEASNDIYYSSGNVGVGTSNPASKLEVFDNNATLARFSGGHSGIQGIQVERQSGDHIRLVTSYTGFGGGLESSSKLRFAVSGNTLNSPSMVLDQSGNLGIGTQNIDGWKLAVGGSIRAEEIKVETGWADYVFEADYELRTLAELSAYIDTYGHLPNIPSADEVAANGVKLGDMNRLLLEKIEELTLYILQQEARIEKLESEKE